MLVNKGIQILRKRHTIHYNQMVAYAPLLIIADAMTVYAGGWFCAWWLESATSRSGLIDNPKYGLMVALAALAFPLFMQALGAYRENSSLNLFRQLARNVMAWVSVFLLALALTVAFKVSAVYSRLWLVSWFLVTGMALFLAEAGYWFAVRTAGKRGYRRRRIAVIGQGEQCQRLVTELTRDHAEEFELVACFGDAGSNVQQALVGSVEDAVNRLNGDLADQVEEVWIVQSAQSATLARGLYHSAQLRMFNLRLVPDVHGFSAHTQQIAHLGSHILIGLSTDPQGNIEGAAKLVMDKAGAFLGLMILSPLMLFIALLIRVNSPGPVLYRQSRHGRYGKEFAILKFRTMAANRSHRKGQPLRQVDRNDDRVTAVGRFLRSWSLDELPQLLNVLCGDMSLVGPRPHEVGMNIDAAGRDFKYRLRHRVRPGMTGWAQVHGFRGPAVSKWQLDKRVEHDLWYIDNWTIWLDIKILLMTFLVGIRHKNAF